jgi:hypothetical protein
MKHLPRADSTRRGKPVEAAARLARLGMPVFPSPADPADVLEPVKDAIHSRPGPFRCLDDGPAMHVGITVERPDEDLQDVEKRASNPDRSRHSAYLT